MNRQTRRWFVKLITAAVGVSSLAACGGFGQTATTITALVPQWATDVANISAAAANYVGTLTGPIASTAATAVSTLGSVAKQIADIASSPVSSVTQGLINSFSSALAGVISSVGGQNALGSIGTFGTILQLALQLLPGILSIAGVALAGPPVDSMALSRARAYLSLAAHR